MKSINYEQFDYLSRSIDLFLEKIAVNQECIFSDDLFKSMGFSYLLIIFSKTQIKEIDLTTKQINLYLDNVVERYSFYLEHIRKDFPDDGRNYAVHFLKDLGFQITEPLKPGQICPRYSSKDNFYIINS